MKRKALLMLLAAALALALLGCGGAELRAVERCAEQYLQTFRQDGIEKAVAYCHFEANDVYSQDEHRALYVRSGCAIQDYRIRGIDKVNDGLYALTLDLQLWPEQARQPDEQLSAAHRRGQTRGCRAVHPVRRGCDPCKLPAGGGGH